MKLELLTMQDRLELRLDMRDRQGTVATMSMTRAEAKTLADHIRGFTEDRQKAFSQRVRAAASVDESDSARRGFYERQRGLGPVKMDLTLLSLRGCLKLRLDMRDQPGTVATMAIDDDDVLRMAKEIKRFVNDGTSAFRHQVRAEISVSDADTRRQRTWRPAPARDLASRIREFDKLQAQRRP